MLIEIAKGMVSNRGYIIDSKDLIKHIVEGQELYRSYFGFDEKIKEHIQSGRKTPQGFIGNFEIRQIVLDVDRKTDTLDHCIQRTRTLVNRLIKEFDLEDNFQIWFSGRGFHIHIPDMFGFKPSNELPNIVRATVEAHFPEVDLKPIQPRGLIRVGRTINAKSKLYKIPIRESEVWFLTEEQILKWAINPRKDVQIQSFTEVKEKFQIINPPKKTVESSIQLLKPTRVVTCMQHCYNAGAVPGTRHERILSMTSWLHREGIPMKGAIAMMKDYAPTMDEYEIEKIVTDTYGKGGYNYGCESKVMKEFCDSQCIFYAKKNYLPEVFGHKEIERSYKIDMDKDWQKTSLNLAPFFGIKDSKGYWLRPGHLVGLIGDTGSSKSALLQNIALKFKDFGQYLYINTEMPYEELFERFIQIEYRMTVEEVRSYYRENDNSLGNALQHIKYTKNVPNYDEIVTLVKTIQPKVLIIDVIDDIKPGKDRSINSQEDMYTGLKQLSRDLKMITILVHHISKSSAVDEKGQSKQLNKHSAKGSSAFEQKCDVMIGIEGDPNLPYRVLRHLKGRSTAPFVASYIVNPKYFRYELQNGEQNE